MGSKGGRRYVSAAIALLVMGFSMARPTPAPAAQSTTVAVYRDATIDETQPDTNLGTATTLSTRTSPKLRSYLRFEVPALPGTITRATLRVTPMDAGPGFKVRTVNATWSETKITYKNAPSLGTVLATPGAFPAGKPVDADVTSQIKTGRVDLALTSSDSAVRYPSREAGEGKPILIIETDTAPQPTDPVIAAAGDIACSPSHASFNGGAGTATACRQRATSTLLGARPYDAILALGDNQYEAATLDEFGGGYGPTWGAYKASTFAIAGNHEYATTGAAGYFDYFGARAGDPAKGYYSFDLGTWHIVALNSNCGSVSCAVGSKQEKWLRADLASSTATCTLAFFHHARFTSSMTNVSSVDPFWRALYDAGADVVVSGHAHNYERFAPQTPDKEPDPARGIREFVSGLGGRSLHSFTSTKPNSEVRYAGGFGILELTLRAGAYDWRFVSEAGKTFSDSGTGTCH